ncbi:hypothetical protein ACIP2Y_18900 [Streptomyces sviceus]|uniref:hypothetical protein n=1 Tax=Streptomyces sviceus TaxID=285530 RepID=UPI00380CFCF6
MEQDVRMATPRVLDVADELCRAEELLSAATGGRGGRGSAEPAGGCRATTELLGVFRLPDVVLQVLPFQRAISDALMGSMVLLETHDHERFAFTDGPSPVVLQGQRGWRLRRSRVRHPHPRPPFGATVKFPEPVGFALDTEPLKEFAD